MGTPILDVLTVSEVAVVHNLEKKYYNMVVRSCKTKVVKLTKNSSCFYIISKFDWHPFTFDSMMLRIAHFCHIAFVYFTDLKLCKGDICAILFRKLNNKSHKTSKTRLLNFFTKCLLGVKFHGPSMLRTLIITKFSSYGVQILSEFGKLNSVHWYRSFFKLQNISLCFIKNLKICLVGDRPKKYTP